MRILVSYRGIPQSPGWATGDLVVKAFRALGHEVYPYAKFYQQNQWVEGRSFGTNNYRSLGLDDHEFDLVLYMECNDGDPQYHELALARTRKIACWLFDTSYYHDRCKSLVDYFRFDHVFLANPLTIREYRVWGYKNVNYLPYACDPEFHMRPLSHPKAHDVALVGSIREDRVGLQKELSKHGRELRLIGGVFREAYIDALASIKIVINQNPPEGRGLLNMRFFEAQAAGAVICTEHDDMHANWDAGLRTTGVLTYQDAEQIAQNCKTFLVPNDDLSYASIAACSQASVLQNHTYQNRCKQLLETIFPYETV